jgi:site-specific recombinase XerD
VVSGDASRGDERAVHLIRNTLHGTIAYANFAGDLDDAHTGPQTILDALFDRTGHNTRLIQDWLGHRAIQHTARYTELSPTRFKEVWR